MNNLCTRFINSIDTSWPFDFVQSVFTKEDISNIPTLTGQLDKVFRLLVALISTFIHNFDIYIDGTY